VAACPHCPLKQQVIDKYSHLAALLARKAAKYDNSKSKISGISSSLATHSHRTLASTHVLLTALARIVSRRETQTYLQIKQAASRHVHGWAVSEGCCTGTSPKDLLIQERRAEEGGDGKLEKKTVSSKMWQNGMTQSSSSHCSLSAGFQKDLARKLFLATLKNGSHLAKISSLKVEVEDGVRRQEKEIAKKR
jgi:hypothetical protein